MARCTSVSRLLNYQELQEERFNCCQTGPSVPKKVQQEPGPSMEAVLAAGFKPPLLQMLAHQGKCECIWTLSEAKAFWGRPGASCTKVKVTLTYLTYVEKPELHYTKNVRMLKKFANTHIYKCFPLNIPIIVDLIPHKHALRFSLWIYAQQRNKLTL